MWKSRAAVEKQPLLRIGRLYQRISFTYASRVSFHSPFIRKSLLTFWKVVKGVLKSCISLTAPRLDGGKERGRSLRAAACCSTGS